MTVDKRNKLVATILLLGSLLFFLFLLLQSLIPAIASVSNMTMLAIMFSYGIFLVVCIALINGIVIPTPRRFNLKGVQAKAIINAIEPTTSGPVSGLILSVTVLPTASASFDAQIFSISNTSTLSVGGEVSVIYDPRSVENIILAADQIPSGERIN